MAFKVFISYSGNADDQAVVWRLQTLAAAQGIHAHVPRRTAARHTTGSVLRTPPPAEMKEIADSDIVLAIITARTDRAVESELSYALGLNRPIVPIVSEGVELPQSLQRMRVFKFSPWTQPGVLENQILAYLSEQKLGKERLQAAGAVIAVGLGLLLLSAVAKD